MAATGTPTVVVLVSGRPLDSAVDRGAHSGRRRGLGAGSCTWAGQAVAEVLAGSEPSPEAPDVVLPKHVGQQMVIYSRKLSSLWADYVEGDNQPLWEFGYRLSLYDVRLRRADGRQNLGARRRC